MRFWFFLAQFFLSLTFLQVHERTIESDFLLIVLKSLLSQRSDLK